MILVGNPFYPVPFLFFPGVKPSIFGPSVLSVVMGSQFGFLGTLNAFISEFMVWAIVIPLTVAFYFLDIRKRRLSRQAMPVRLVVIGFFVLAVAFGLPSAFETNIMVSSFRYFYAAIVPFILFSFLYWKKKGYIAPLLICSLSGILFVGFPLGFYPKLLLVAVPLSVYVYFNGYDVLVARMSRKPLN